MGRQDVRKALEAMEADDAVRARLADGDFAAVDGLDLSADEQTLVQDAASDMPEVSGFSFDTHIKFDGVEGESTHQDHKGEIQLVSLNFGQPGFKFQTAVKYGFKF